MDSHHSAFTTTLRSLLPTLCVWGPTWETSSSLYKDEIFCNLSKNIWWGGTALWFSKHTCLRTSLTTHSQSTSQRDMSGLRWHVPTHPEPGVSYPAEILVLLTNNGRSLIYTKCLTFRQLQLAEVNLTACWDLAITGVSTDLWPSECDLKSVSTLLSVPSISATR